MIKCLFTAMWHQYAPIQSLVYYPYILLTFFSIFPVHLAQQ